MLQKFYSENHLTKRKIVNAGEIKKFYVEEAHPPIIEKTIFLAVQNLLKKHQEQFSSNKPNTAVYPFTGKFNVAAAVKIIVEKQRQPASSGFVLHTTQRAKNTVLQQSRSLKIR